MEVPLVEDGYIALVTLGAASVAAIAPIISLWVTWLIRSREKTADWARQDLVAIKVEKSIKEERERQEAVARQAADAAKLLLAAQEKTTQQNTETQGKLNQIHTLVNSNLTREMQDRLAALKGQVFLTKELMRLNKQNDIEPSDETETSLRNLEAVVSGLETSLRERNNATLRADDEQT